jgi:hypothetical protein
MSQALEAQGVYPPGSTERLMTSLESYDKARSQVPTIIPEEYMPSMAGLMEKRANLEAQKTPENKPFHAKIDEQIAAIDKRIETMQESPNPILDEVDDLTGDTGEATPFTEADAIKASELELGVTPEAAKKEVKDIERIREEEIRKRGLGRLFPIDIDETTASGKQILKEKNEQELKIKELDAELAALEAPKAESQQRKIEAIRPQEGVEYGAGGMVKFAEGVEVPYKYKIIEAESLKPSHLASGERNPEHTIALAQPKERGDIQSRLAQEKIAKAPNLGEVGGSPNPYFGAPVVNLRGEVIQGNNRSLGLKRHYDEGGDSYKNQLIENAEKFGVTKEQIDAMKNPILVRESAIDDALAVELGNYDVKDLETGGKQRIDPITTVRKMTAEDKNKLAAIIFDRDYATVKEAIRENQAEVGSIISKQINAAQRNTIFDKEGNINPRGMDDIENIVNNMIFESGSAVLPEAFSEIPYIQQKNIQKAIKHIFNTPESASILPEIQNAILGLYDFRKSNIENFNSWLSTMDLFEGKTPKDVFTPLEIKLMEIINKAKNQSELSKQLGQYAELVNGKPAELFEGEVAGIPKKEAIKKQFNIEYEDVAKRYAEPEGTPQPKRDVPEPEPRAEQVEADQYETFRERELARPEFDAEFNKNRYEFEDKEDFIRRKFCE